MKTREELDAIAKGLRKDSYAMKERMAIPLQEMPVQNPEVRIHNMSEVALGFTENQAIVEANRCLSCKNHPCIEIGRAHV